MPKTTPQNPQPKIKHGECYSAWKLAQITSDLMGDIKSMMMLQECIDEVQL